jgi:BirA family biotin operon repressor/biotin-[acetyl-CoA-carboxylase] ligase
MSHATVVVSGTKIAEDIGTSRSEVWRLIQQLRGLGVDVAGHPATGYQLRVVPDLLLPEMLAPSLKGTIFGGTAGGASSAARQIHHYYKIGSTNTEAMQSAKNSLRGVDAARTHGIRRVRPASIVRSFCVR